MPSGRACLNRLQPQGSVCYCTYTAPPTTEVLSSDGLSVMRSFVCTSCWTCYLMGRMLLAQADPNDGQFTIQAWASSANAGRIRLAFTEFAAIDWGGA